MATAELSLVISCNSVCQHKKYGKTEKCNFYSHASFFTRHRIPIFRKDIGMKIFMPNNTIIKNAHPRQHTFKPYCQNMSQLIFLATTNFKENQTACALLPYCIFAQEIMARVSPSNHNPYPFLISSSKAAAKQVAVQRGWTVVNRVPIIVSAFGVISAPVRENNCV